MQIKSNYWVTVLSLILMLPVFSQKREIKGTVKSFEEPIPYATIILKNLKNDFLVGTTTDEKGFYLLKYEKGNYLIEFSFIGYKTNTAPIHLDKDTVKNIDLSPEAFTMEEIMITAETTTVKQLIDKKIIEVGKDLLSNGGSAATVLSQLSEVDADESGSISLRGNSNVQVLVNGKPSPLSSSELLTQISASEIKTIEIITSPSAKYKADGLTGIINILTKKKVKKGITITNSVSYNSLNAFSGNSSLSYGAKKINYKIGVFYRKNRSESTRNKERFGTQPYLEKSTNKYQGDVYRINAGMDWFYNKKNEFSWAVNYSDNQHDTDIDKTIFQETVESFQYSNSSHIHRTVKLNGNYRHIFNNTEDFLEIDIDLSKNNNTLQGLFTPNITVFDNIVKNEILTNNIALDNSFTINDNLKFESGYLGYVQQLDNKRTFNDASIDLSEDLYTTKQTTHALYAQMNYDKDKTGIQIGLRGELYNRKAVFVKENINLDNTFADLFPSVHIKFAPNDIHTFGLGYNRRTYRPRLYQINPISSQSDTFSFRKGNPNLDSEFSNNIDITYQIKKEKANFSSTISYQKVNSIIIQNQTFINDIQTSSYINGGNSNAYGIEFSLSYKPIKGYRSNFNFNWNYEDLQSPQFSPKNFSRSFQFTFKNNYKISDKANADISWRYRGPSINFYGERNATQKVDVGFRYKILNKKGSFSLRFTDIFDTYLYKGVEYGADFKRSYTSKSISRAVHISLSYSFNKGKLEKRKKKKRDY